MSDEKAKRTKEKRRLENNDVCEDAFVNGEFRSIEEIKNDKKLFIFRKDVLLGICCIVSLIAIFISVSPLAFDIIIMVNLFFALMILFFVICTNKEINIFTISTFSNISFFFNMFACFTALRFVLAEGKAFDVHLHHFLYDLMNSHGNEGLNAGFTILKILLVITVILVILVMILLIKKCIRVIKQNSDCYQQRNNIYVVKTAILKLLRFITGIEEGRMVIIFITYGIVICVISHFSIPTDIDIENVRENINMYAPLALIILLLLMFHYFLIWLSLMVVLVKYEFNKMINRRKHKLFPNTINKEKK